MDAVCSYVQHSNPTYTFSLFFSLSLSPLFSLFLSLYLSLSLSLKHIFLLAPALSQKHARTYPWKKKDGGNEMHELSFNKGER